MHASTTTTGTKRPSAGISSAPKRSAPVVVIDDDDDDDVDIESNSDDSDSPPHFKQATNLDRMGKRKIEAVNFATDRVAASFETHEGAAAAFGRTVEDIERVCNQKLFTEMVCGFGLRYEGVKRCAGRNHDGPVNQYSQKGEFLARWRTAPVATAALRMGPGTIRHQCCQNRGSTLATIVYNRKFVAPKIQDTQEYIWILAEDDPSNRNDLRLLEIMCTGDSQLPIEAAPHESAQVLAHKIEQPTPLLLPVDDGDGPIYMGRPGGRRVEMIRPGQRPVIWLSIGSLARHLKICRNTLRNQIKVHGRSQGYELRFVAE